MSRNWYKQIKCKLKRHMVDGTYQGCYPDIGLDEICLECGSTLHKLTEKEFRIQYKKAGYSGKELEQIVSNWKGYETKI